MAWTGPNDAGTIAGLFAALVAAGPTRPAVTYYDEVSGERTELSGATLDNWVSKTANLLVDGCGLGTGDTAAVRLPPHWQTAAVLLGCWSAGLSVAYGEPTPTGHDVAFAATTVIAASATSAASAASAAGAAGAASAADPNVVERYALGLAPLGQPLREVPPGWLDFVAEVRGHGDRYPGRPPAGDAPALVDSDGSLVSHRDLRDRALERARRLGIGTGARVLIDTDAHPYPLDWLLAPLAAGASTVLVAGLVPWRAEGRTAALARTERADHIIGPDNTAPDNTAPDNTAPDNTGTDNTGTDDAGRG